MFFSQILAAFRAKDHRPHSPDRNLIRKYLELPTEWELGVSIHDGLEDHHAQLFGHRDLFALRQCFQDLVEGKREITPAEWERMQGLVEIDRKVSFHLEREGPAHRKEERYLSVVDWLTQTVDKESDQNLLSLLSTEDPEAFGNGYEAVMRSL